MRLLSARVVVALAAVMVAWGAGHLLISHDVSVTPAVWPGATPAPSAPAAPVAIPSSPSTSSPAASGGIPVLPGALQQLNTDTRDTAIGLYGLVTDIEAALAGQLGNLVQTLEPGR